jgi:RES domain-containing protein
MIARARGSLLPNYVVFPLEFDDALVAEIRPQALPPDWRAYPAPAGLGTFGDAWLDGAQRPVLRVPNAIIPDESTFILNPGHPDFRRIRIGASYRLDVDLRLRP